MSIRNLLKIPKIALRTPCDHKVTMCTVKSPKYTLNFFWNALHITLQSFWNNFEVAEVTCIINVKIHEKHYNIE